MLKKLMETMDKELKETRRTISQQKETMDKETEIIERNQTETLELKSIKA